MSLANWFAGIEDQPAAAAPPARHADNVAVFTGASIEEEADSPLPFSRGSGQELYGAAHDTGARLPLRCRGCRKLRLGQCEALTCAPDDGCAALCRCFVLREGAKFGRCWLYRVTLEGGRLAWLGNTPPINQAEAESRARLQYGAMVQEVAPMPGWVAMPAW